MTTIILGGGLAGLSLAHFLKDDSIVLEKEEQTGGLCRSFQLNGVSYDVGPHIMFSRNHVVLDEMVSLVETSRIKRSNKIFHKGRLVKYPFENDLAALEPAERDYCLKEFLSNPYEGYGAGNMLHFFLKTFGEGITKLYLQPYNEKIWKFDPAFMDTQMVERIPKPPKEDIIKSAQGVETEGYVHQLYFHYPKKGGIQCLVDAYRNLASKKAKIVSSVNIRKIGKDKGGWIVETDKGRFSGKTLINCMPLHELFQYIEAPDEIRNTLNELKYNSLYTITVQSKKDNAGDNFALNFADKNVVFHRISKLNFLGKNYCLPKGGSTIIAEITYRPESYLAGFTDEEIKQKVLDDLEALKLVKKTDVTAVELRKFKYAYVIYDLSHRKNAAKVLQYLKGIGIRCCGRFAEFEYLNMDQTIEHSHNLADEFNGVSHGG
ncbi:Flavin containing amine oxidoreductase [uncultured archaeon]|nr:Flavin containing amine oxidoreductase [uncultured archaeon]